MCIRDSGKLDRRALPDAEFTGDVYVAPRTAQEALLCGLYAEVTGAERVGIHDRFFRIGGDSISAIRLVSRARAEGVHFRVRDVFTCPSPEGLSGIASDGSDVGVQVWPEEGEVPLLPIFRDVLSMPGPINRFNQTVCLEVPEGVTHDGVVSALDRLRGYHSVLRLRTEGRGIGCLLYTSDAADE